MKKILLLPHYIKSSSKKILEKAKGKEYLICFYKKGQAISKFKGSFNIYDVEKLVAIGSKTEYHWAEEVMSHPSCKFKEEVVFPVTLTNYEEKNKKICLKNLEKVLNVL